MNDIPHLIKRSWRTLATCSVALGAVVGAGAGMTILQDRLRGTLDTAMQERSRLRSEHEALADNLRAALAGKSDFTQQQRDGLVGAAQREEWVQSLIAAYQSRHFTGSPEYKLLAPAAYTGAADSPSGGGSAGALPGGSGPAGPAGGGAAAAAAAVAAPGAPGAGPATAAATQVAVQVHELRFQLAQAHEVDVLGILDRLQLEHGPIMRTKGCALSEAGPEGLKAACTVQFLNVARAESAAPGGMGGAAGGAPGIPTP